MDTGLEPVVSKRRRRRVVVRSGIGGCNKNTCFHGLIRGAADNGPPERAGVTRTRRQRQRDRAFIFRRKNPTWRERDAETERESIGNDAWLITASRGLISQRIRLSPARLLCAADRAPPLASAGDERRDVRSRHRRNQGRPISSANIRRDERVA